MSLNSNQKSLCHLATTELCPKETKKGNSWKMAKARLALIRGVTRFYGARGKKQVWCPRVRPWGLSETNGLHWRKYF